MGTRSNIIVEHEDGKWHCVYCHWDGYPSHHGPILLNHYSTQRRAESLVSFGDISSLERLNNKPEGHSFDNRVKDHTVYYGRDRGEKGTEAKIGASLAEVWPGTDTGAEFIYVWRRDVGKWFIGDADEGTETLKPLDEVMNKQVPPPTPNVKAFGGNFVIGKWKPSVT